MGVLQRYDEGPRKDLLTDQEQYQNSPVPKYMLIAACTVCAFLVYHIYGFNVFKCRKRRSYWEHKSSEVIKSYIYRMCFFHVINSFALGLIHDNVYQIDRDPDSLYIECFQPFAQRIFVLFTAAVAVSVAIVRFMSISFVQGELVTTKTGHQIFKPGGRKANLGFSTNSAGFRLVVSPFMVVCLITFALMILILYGAISHEATEKLMDYKICFQSWHQQTEGELKQVKEVARVVLIIIEFILPVLTVLAVEHILYMITGFDWKASSKEQSMAYFVVLNSPFVNVNLVTTWSGWLILSTLVHFILGASGTYLLFFLILYILFDTLCLLLLCFLTSKKNRILTA